MFNCRIRTKIKHPHSGVTYQVYTRHIGIRDELNWLVSIYDDKGTVVIEERVEIMSASIYHRSFCIRLIKCLDKNTNIWSLRH